MFVTIESPWMEPEDDNPADTQKAVAININNGNTIYIREYRDYTYKFTVELEVTIGIKAWENRVIAIFDTAEEANGFCEKMLCDYEKGIKVSRLNEKMVPFHIPGE